MFCAARQSRVNLVPCRMKLPHAVGPALHRVGHANELFKRNWFLKMGQHGTPPDQLTLTPHPQRGPFHLDQKQPGRDVPKSGGIEPRRDVVLQGGGKVQAAFAAGSTA